MDKINLDPVLLGSGQKVLSNLFEQVKKNVKLEWIVTSVVDNLKESEKEYLKGTCPFCHDAVHPFTINRKKDIFYCYSCQVSGDVVAFTAKYNQLTQIQAASYLYDLYKQSAMKAIEEAKKAMEKESKASKDMVIE
jgi:DNA primase